MRYTTLATVQHRITVGAPLPFNVYDADRTLLLARRHRVESTQQLASLCARGTLVDLDELLSATERAAQAPLEELPRLWTACLDKVGRVLADSSAPNFRGALDEAADPVAALIDRDPDLAIFQVLRQDDNPHRQYGIHHSVHTAIIARLVAQRLAWPQRNMVSAFKAALTMNLAMLELQGQLAEQRTPLTDAQRLAVREHPQRAVEMLQQAGITDGEWLGAVAQHHEERDGSVPVRGLRYHVLQWGDAALVAADSARPWCWCTAGWTSRASFQFVVDALAACPVAASAGSSRPTGAVSASPTRRAPTATGSPTTWATSTRCSTRWCPRRPGRPARPQHGRQRGHELRRRAARRASAGWSTWKASACRARGRSRRRAPGAVARRAEDAAPLRSYASLGRWPAAAEEQPAAAARQGRLAGAALVATAPCRRPLAHPGRPGAQARQPGALPRRRGAGDLEAHHAPLLWVEGDLTDISASGGATATRAASSTSAWPWCPGRKRGLLALRPHAAPRPAGEALAALLGPSWRP
jgi:hypothetical protein